MTDLVLAGFFSGNYPVNYGRGKYLRSSVQPAEEGIFVCRVMKDTAPGERRGVLIVKPLCPLELFVIFGGEKVAARPPAGCAKDISAPNQRWWYAEAAYEIPWAMVLTAREFYSRQFGNPIFPEGREDYYPKYPNGWPSTAKNVWNGGDPPRLGEPAVASLCVGEAEIFRFECSEWNTREGWASVSQAARPLWEKWGEFVGSSQIREARLTVATEYGHYAGEAKARAAQAVLGFSQNSLAWQKIYQAVS